MAGHDQFRDGRARQRPGSGRRRRRTRRRLAVTPGAMRLTARIVAVTAALAVTGGGITAWAVTDTGSGARARGGSTAALAPGSPQRTAQSTAQSTAESTARLSPSPSPSPSHSPAGPLIEVTGAPRGVKAKGAVFADGATRQVVWGSGRITEGAMRR